ncbi:MAG: hypothetical protein MUE51_12800 [Thermoleophilia bacterium]|jgi:hypothetical protein|nr:hypothetical protein [Thermoleophilia bacterium]
MQRDADPTLSDLQRALLGYDPAPLETALIDWTRANWPMAARAMVYAKREAADTVGGVGGVRSDEGRLVMEVAARVAIAERELMCRAIAAVLPQWLADTYGLAPKDDEAAPGTGEA